ncbi:regulator of chromosome condensation 1/beta-lactamase-inhibitor protein II [Xylaria palmicola]|nr:regulator of chromosome condensation 1/beta-lactamase-inhibitor protein II [Xylaria palmicola]
MDLFASGFNAWRQLHFSPTDPSVEPDDVASFEKVLTDKLIEIPYASLTCTIVNTSARLRHAGSMDEDIESELMRKLLSSTAAIAGNGTVAIYNGQDAIIQHAPSTSPCAAEVKGRQTFTGMHDIIQLVAYETGFVALSGDGKVWTWGDERYASTLGREASTSSPAEKPGLVEDLDDLPSGKIKKIAAGGYTVLALTQGNDLYGWGGHPARQPILDMLSSSPSPVDIEENDIVDCSVGETHAIVLTTSGDVYVIGENANGQLGLGVPSKRITQWKRVALSAAGKAVVGVKAGHRSSFIVTKDMRLT